MAREKLIEKESLVPHPKEGDTMVAHEAIEKQLLQFIHKKRMPHSLLFTGPQGIGKATLAYRLARFLLSPQPEAGGLFGDALPAESLHISKDSGTFRRVALGSHPDLLVLEADAIKIEEARSVAEFLSLTPAESNWRVVIIDSADAMNRNAANALLKTLEEPPAQALLILISHAPGGLLPTIRSRCHTMRFSALSKSNFARIMGNITPELSLIQLQHLALLSGNSAGVALSLLAHNAEAIYTEIISLLAKPDAIAFHNFAERFSRKDADEQWKTFQRLFLWSITRIATNQITSQEEILVNERTQLESITRRKPLDLWAELWEKSSAVFSDTDRLYLDRKQVILTLLREAAE